jgi:Heparinase II/III-like protein/Heparinase II/III N-terminus
MLPVHFTRNTARMYSLLRRLRRMGIGELRTRLQQEFSKRACSRLAVPSLTLQQLLRDEASFYFHSSDVPRLIDSLQAAFPTESAQILRSAEQILSHRFDLLGYTALDYGTPINWHLDVVNGKQAPRKPSYQIHFLDFHEAGDCKITWELNRHQHLVTLAKAFLLSSRPKFLKELIAQWYSWREQNPYGIGINWVSSLEVAFRALSWMWVDGLLSANSRCPKSFLQDLRTQTLHHAEHISRYVSTYFSPNTHLLGEAFALFTIGTIYRNLPQAARWRTSGWNLILEQAAKQVGADGMHFEHSTYYHVYALDFFLHSWILATRSGLKIPPEFDATLLRMLNALALLCRGGAVTRIGDDDGGRLCNGSRNQPQHLTDPLLVGAVVLQKPEYKVISQATEELLWLSGKEGLEYFRQLPRFEQPLSSTSLKKCGIHLMAQSSPAAQLAIDAGPQGSLGAGHGHADALSVVLNESGHEWLVDPGTYVYVSADDTRELYRGTLAHNTLTVDSKSQSEPVGPFAWGDLPSISVERWIARKSFALLIASHNGYTRLADPVIHRRWVFQLNSNFWFVRDLATCVGRHTFVVNWHLGPDCAAERVEGHVTLQHQDGSRFHIVWPTMQQGEVDLIQGMYSRSYGRCQPSPIVRFTQSKTGTAEFATLLVRCQTLPLPPALSRFDADQSACYDIQMDSILHKLVFSSPGHDWRLGKIESNADFVYCGIQNGRLDHLIACNCSYLRFSGDTMYERRESLPLIETRPNLISSLPF